MRSKRSDAGPKTRASRRASCASPTGSGKTRTAVYFALDRWVQKRRKVLWLCHRTELMEQAVEAFQKLKAAAGRSFVVGRFGNKGEGADRTSL
jgi:superfamily II DNA or RNA helicase